jgi:hypothetical protein
MSVFLDSLKATTYTGTSKARNRIVTTVAWIAAVLFVVTVCFLVTRTESDPTAKRLARAYLMLWTVVPPAWFWLEYHLIWQTAVSTERESFEQFKHSQELSRNIWLAFVAVLAALYFK